MERVHVELVCGQWPANTLVPRRWCRLPGCNLSWQYYHSPAACPLLTCSWFSVVALQVTCELCNEQFQFSEAEVMQYV
jgi:hypothetical protein